MTTISSAPPFDMDFSQSEDIMERAPSPPIRRDDLGLVLDPWHELAPVFEDSMDEDSTDVQGEAAEQYDDDEMVDEDIAVQDFPDNASDLNMEQDHEHAGTREDEDILYEEEDILEDQETDQHEEIPTETNTDFHQLSETAKATPSVEVAEEHAIEEDFDLADQVAPNQLTSLSEPLLIATFGEADVAVQSDHTDSIEPHNTYDQIAQTKVDAGRHQEKTANTISYEDTDTIAESGANSIHTTSNTNQIDTTEQPEPQNTNDDAADKNNNTNQDELVDQQYELVEPSNVVLHTVKVLYQDSEICLFPPQDDDGTETFFLSESSLAHESLEKLLASCRDVLADTIGIDDELVLDIALLGLHISEGSKYATEITLSQILDVYLALSHNENKDQIEPLYCNLSSRVCLASQYAYLTAAAQEGKTMSEIIDEHSDTPRMEPLEPQEGFAEEQVEDEHVYNESTETSPTTRQQNLAKYTEHDDVATGPGATAPFAVRTDGALEPTGTTEDQATDDIEEYDGITKPVQGEDTEALNFSIVHGEDAVHDEQGVEPSNTEYQEDIDEAVNDDQDQLPQEHEQSDDDDFETHSANDENASPGTVEAENEDEVEEHLDDVENFNEMPAEHTALDVENDQRALAVLEVSDEHPLRSMENGNIVTDPLQLEEADADDLFELAPEDEEQPAISETNSANVKGEDFDEDGELFAEADASTDRTLDHAQDDEDDPDALVLPPTPAKAQSSKRKAEVDDEDDFDLLEIETPDKKRRRPS